MTGLLSLSTRVGEALKDGGLSICAAESCTGGLLLSALTDVPGSSAYALGGLVTYADEAKMHLLGVGAVTISAYGAVSEPTAREMAIGARRVFGADIAVSVTGIAGPGGGTGEKPVGLTYIGLSARDGLLKVNRHDWAGDRVANKEASVQAALEMLLNNLG